MSAAAIVGTSIGGVIGIVLLICIWLCALDDEEFFFAWLYRKFRDEHVNRKRGKIRTRH